MYRNGIAACLLALALAGLGDAQTKALDEVVTLSTQAESHWKRGEYKLAAAAYERALAACEQLDGKNAPRTGTICLKLGRVYQDLQDYAKAKALMERALRIYQKDPEKNRPSIATAHNDLGLLCRDLGQLPQAATHLEGSLTIKEAQRPRDEFSIARTINLLALVLQDLGQDDKAEALYERGLRLPRAKLQKGTTDLHLNILHNLAVVYQRRKKFAEAERVYRDALAIWEKKLGPNDLNVATVVFNLATVQQERRKFADAESLYKRSLGIYEAKQKDLEVAKALNHLAGLYLAMNQPAKAEPRYRRALRIREDKLGKEHPAVAETLHDFALFLEHEGRTKEAGDHLDRARRISRRHVGHILPGLPERDQVKFLANRERKDFERALALQLANRPGDRLFSERDFSAVTRRAASWMLNGKALSQEALARSHLLSRDEKDQALRQPATQLRQAREELARLAMSRPKPGEEASRQKRLAQLEKEEERLAGLLARAGSSAVAPGRWFDLQEVTKALPRDAVLIDVGRFHRFDFKGTVGERRGEERYVAWVTSAAGRLAAVDLGPAKAIDDAVEAVRRPLERGRETLKLFMEDPEKAEKALREPLGRLSKLVLGKLKPHIESAKRWIVSPDGSLWLVPWEMLLLPDGKYAVEEHALSYVLSGRDLLTRARFTGKTERPVVVADPEYDLTPKAGADLGRGVFSVQRLENTRVEAEAIGKPLRALTKEVPVQLLRDKALESTVKAAKNPRVLVLATHGFFLSEEKARKMRLGTDNPLSRCGLLLAGCNRATKSGANDGVLTGLEVLGMDLRGTEMVVLSACQTGLGNVRAGEGIAGLRQAFRLAGAESVVSTLWEVPDGSSALLMAHFFRGLGKGKSRPDALRDAQCALIEEHRGKYAVAHPLFWAAYTVTGGRD